jgi:galactose mutarotase-like enzyme
MQSIPYLGQTIRQWRVGASTFLAWPEAGARLMHWNHTRIDGSVREVIHWPDLTDLETPVASIRGGNPILFPFSARTFDRGDIHFWRGRDGQRRPMPMHGFARQGTFALDHIDPTGFRATLEPSDEDQSNFPFRYRFSVIYRFEAQRITCEFALTNHDEVPLPWSAGHHFYFTAPWTEPHTRDDYQIILPPGKAVRQSPTGTLFPGPNVPRTTPLADPNLVDTIHTELAHNPVRFGPADGSEFIDVSVGAGPQPNPGQAIVTWTADPEAPFYCVEPWMGPPNAIEHKQGLHWVPPGDTDRFSVSVAIG